MIQNNDKFMKLGVKNQVKTLSSRTVGAWLLKALEPRPGGGPPPCNVATVAMGATVNNSIAVAFLHV